MSQYNLHLNYQTSVKNSVIGKDKYIDACVSLPLPVEYNPLLHHSQQMRNIPQRDVQ
jgi:hypothetical protein